MNKREELSKEYPDLLVMNPTYLDEAIIGVVSRINLSAICYDTNKVIELLIQHEGMTDEEAIEHFEYNMKGSWVGETTPVFLE